MIYVIIAALAILGVGIAIGATMKHSSSFEAGRAQGWNDCYFKQVERENARRERDRRFKHKATR